jgi:alpha-glucosidase
MPRKSLLSALLLLFSSFLFSQKKQAFTVVSPDGNIMINVTTGAKLQWQVKHKNQSVIIPSSISMELQSGEVLGENVMVSSSQMQTINNTISATAYKKSIITNHYNQLSLTCKGNYGVIFRAYNDGVAYSFFTLKDEELVIKQEKTEYNFAGDYQVLIPFISDLRGGEKYTCSFEEFYTRTPVSKIDKDTLGYLPLLVELPNNKKAVLLDADVQDYPATLIRRHPDYPYGLQTTFAPYPLAEALGGFNKINYMVTKRADYIAKVKGSRSFPWRAIVISEKDKDLLNNDMVQKLSAAPGSADLSWIQPGKVSWDWWNNWNLTGVNFKPGINNQTYKYYIDFASRYKLEYIILDEGWSDDWDLTKVKPEINLPELIAYAKGKNVKLILWSTWYALSKDIEGLCKQYSALGIAGFKVDFLDRNDQKMVASCYEMGAIAANYHLMLDFHGMFAPQGMQRTWPNIINFEGVRGLEWMKWSADDRVPEHDVRLAFIRMMAGPLDYTPGAMRNASKGMASPNNSSPMSIGTRCHQLAMYIIYEAPLQMLADSPTEYQKDSAYTSFLASIPTTFDETVALDGKVGEYAVIARKKNGNWYIGGLNNWTARELTIDLSVLGQGNYELVSLKDEVNTSKLFDGYKRETSVVTSKSKLKIRLEAGGGWAAILRKK